MTQEDAPRGFFRCPHCRQKTITAWAKLGTRGACPACGERFVGGSWGFLFASLVAPVTMFVPLLFFRRLELPLLWLICMFGVALTLAVGGAIYLFTTPLYRKGSVVARWETIGFVTLVIAAASFAILNTDFSREAGLLPKVDLFAFGGHHVDDPERITSSVHYGDARMQQALKDALEKAGVPYKLENRSGEEYIGWTRAQDVAARKIRDQVDGTVLRGTESQPVGSVAFEDPALQKEFAAWLGRKGIKHEMVKAQGRDFIKWDGPSDLVMQFMRGRPSDCDKVAAAKMGAKKCG